jgi:ankyrin repeat protein
MASEKGHIDIVRELVEKGADVNVKMPEKEITAIIIAAVHNKADVVKFLITNKADVNAYTIKSIPVTVQGMSIGFPPGSCALHFARLHKNKELENLLLKAGAVMEPSMMKK